MTPPVLAAAGITKNFRIGRQEIAVLRGVDLSIAAGEKVALLGQSGAGKSTLLHVLGLLDKPSGGAVRYDGRDVHTLSVQKRALLRHQHIGFVFQFYHLIPELTALQNVLLARMMGHSVLGYWGQRRTARIEAEALLEQVGLKDRLRHRPAELSGGERQRVAIARALIAKPRVVLADEPTGNLDSTTARGVVDLMFSIQQERGLAFLLVTHDENLARRCDRVVRMRDGVVVS
ncbi:MAG: ABC transporter ATP-binding protein [Planctomycetes bacterium]|nr:ABC transporter ATP-binding protein [Planctomycetota bacterium]MBZ0149962.1 ABC transporter ATP-binding protein [Planctomycetota bacterium]MCC7398991.1 ABC transporter ATP-binding protein [Planctomycetota bacterium]